MIWQKDPFNEDFDGDYCLEHFRIRLREINDFYDQQFAKLDQIGER